MLLKFQIVIPLFFDYLFNFFLDISDEVGIELRRDDRTPTDCTHNFCVDFVWKSIGFDR